MPSRFSAARLNTEDDLWNRIKPALRGKWFRLETITPDGMPDCFGLWQGETWWLELKIGKPSLKALRPSQRRFLVDCQDEDITVWCCFGWKHEPHFYEDGDFSVATIRPPFLR